MSFRCVSCREAQPTRAKPIRVVAETRERIYPPRFHGDVCIDAGGSGHEIAREINICASCADQARTLSVGFRRVIEANLGGVR